MGYYDGLGLTTTRASTWETAQKTASPTILVINARGAALSVLAFLVPEEAVITYPLQIAAGTVFFVLFGRFFGKTKSE